MPRFAANLDLLFAEYPFLARFEAAKATGFEAVELLFPYNHAAEDIRQALEGANLSMVLINTPAGDWAKGERGFAAVPGQEARFRQDFQTALEVSRILNARFIHILAGNICGAEAKATFIKNLRWAIQVSGPQNLTIEPINPLDMKDYFLNEYDLAIDILRQVESDRLHLQFDAYHAQRITGNALKAWGKYGHHAAHIQVASADNRNEPICEKIDYPAFFKQLDSEGYQGMVSGEYHPKSGTEAGLLWM